MFFTFICVVILFVSLLYNFLRFHFWKHILYPDQNISVDKSRNQDGLLPLPRLNTVKVLIWMLIFGKSQITSLLLYARQFHKIVYIKVWKSSQVIISDYQLGKELFKNPVFCGKPSNKLISYFAQGSYGIINTFGEAWKGQRKFCNQHLRHFGFGTSSMEILMKKEIEELINNWSRKEGQRFSPNKEFYFPIVSSLWVLLTGERASGNDQELVKLVYSVYGDLRKTTSFPEILIMHMNLKLETVNRIVSWIPIFPGVKAFQKSTTNLRSYFRRIINSRKQALDSNGSPSNFVDAYLQKIHETTDPNSEFFGDTGEMNLVGAMMDFFIAGGDTTADTLAWAMLHLIRNPDVQERIRMEIDAVVGITRSPCLQDRPNCPYTEAFLWEVLRCDPVAAGSLTHAPTEDTNIGPYFIEKGTPMYLNIYGIHYDPEIWGDPHNFRPERFLSEDGKTVVKYDEHCSFSLGLRRCVGEQSAKDNLFLFVSSICQRFILKPDPLSKDPPSIANRKSSLHIPEKFFMVACNR